MPQIPREAIDIYSRDMRTLIKIYWGEGKVLPQTKLAQLQRIAKEIVDKALHRRKAGNKEGSGSSKRRREQKALQASQEQLQDSCSDSFAKDSVSSAAAFNHQAKPSSGFLNKVKQCAYPDSGSRVA